MVNDLDLDVKNYTERLDSDEAVFYFRVKDNKVNSALGGDLSTLGRGFLTVILNDDDGFLYELIGAAVEDAGDMNCEL